MGRKRCDEIRLIERAKRGDKDAIGDLYLRNTETIYRYIFHHVNDATIAEDLTAEVFLSALEGLPNYRITGTPLLAWLYRIARARTVDHWRKQGRVKITPLPETLPSNAPDPEELISTWARWDAVLDVLSQLTVDQQQAIVLRFVEDLDLRTVAAIMGKTTGAIKGLQYRALMSLARLLEKNGQLPEGGTRLRIDRGRAAGD